MSDRERAQPLDAVASNQAEAELGSARTASTQPQTIGFSLLDSPSTPCRWILEHDAEQLQRISRAFVDKQPEGNASRQSVTRGRQFRAVLTNRHRHLGGPVVPKGGTSPRPSGAHHSSSLRSRLPDRFTGIFPGEISGPRAAGTRRGYPNTVLST